MPIHEYPYTDFHEMNLDWIIKKVTELLEAWESFGGNVTATAHASLVPEVSVSGDLKTELEFDFGLVRGNEGPRGPEGPEGPQGKGLEILGVYTTLSDLQSAHPTGNSGDVYLVGSGGSYTMYVWDEDTSDWVDGGPITTPVPSSTNPLMDGVADYGSSLNYAREDHVHPSDTAKQDALVSAVNIKEINDYSLLGSGSLYVQETLVSGTNIKTINTEDLLGSGDISLQTPLVSGTDIKTINTEDLLGSGDISLQVPLVSGTNIKTINNNSLLGSGDLTVQPTLVSGTNIKTINSNSLLGSGDLTIAPASFSLDLLWTNANPSSNFAAQTVAVDLSGYTYVGIIFKSSTGATYNFSTPLYIFQKNSYWSYNNEGGGYLIQRVVNVLNDGSGITFGDCSRLNTYPNGTRTTDNGRLIPYQIYGIA